MNLGGGRRTVEAVAYDIGWQLLLIDVMWDGLIDAFAIHAGKARHPVTWKKIRNEIGDKMNHIADMVEKEGEDSPWADCFRLCGEDDIVQRLHSAPYAQKGAITGWRKAD